MDANATNFHVNAFTFNNASRLVVIQKRATIFTFFILRTLRSVKHIAQFLAALFIKTKAKIQETKIDELCFMLRAILDNHQAMKSLALSFLRLDSVSLV